MIYDFVVDEILELSNFIFMGIEKPNETHKSEKKSIFLVARYVDQKGSYT